VEMMRSFQKLQGVGKLFKIIVGQINLIITDCIGNPSIRKDN